MSLIIRSRPSTEASTLRSVPQRQRVRWAIAGLLIGVLGLVMDRPVQAQPVIFPDPNLESAVREALQLPAPTPIDQTNLAALTNLQAAFRGITNLSGLEGATNLQSLDCGGNPLLEITPLAGLWRLTSLHVGSCQFTNAAPVAGLTNLTFLDIGINRDSSDNSIRDTSFLTNLRRLQWLSLYYLRISDLAPLAGLTALTNLNVSYNYGCSNLMALNSLTNLVECYAASIGLSDLTFVSHMPHLMKLDCGNSTIQDCSPLLGHDLIGLWAYGTAVTNASLVTNFVNLAVLHLDFANLTNAAFIGSIRSLQDLSLDYDEGITNFSFLTRLTNLRYLSLGGDLLGTLAPLGGLGQLNELHLHDALGLTNLTPVSALTNLTHLDLNQVPGLNYALLTNFPRMNWVELKGDGLSTASFVQSMPQINRVDLDNNHFSDLSSLAGTTLGEVHAPNNWLEDISALSSLSHLYYADVRQNFLDLGAAWNVITNLQNNFVNVDYAPQSLSPTLTLWEAPADQCLASGAQAYFAVAASSSAGPLSYQWQFKGVDLAGQTNNFLLLPTVAPGQAGSYRAIVLDSNGGLASAPAHLYVDDPNCGQSLRIVQQPRNTCAAPGEDVTFSVGATTTQPNLYYQWLFNGTNIVGDNVSGDQTDTLMLSAVDATAAGFYQVLVWDDNSNTVASAVVQLKVVDTVSFADENLSNLVYQALSNQRGSPPATPLQLTTLDSLSYLYVGGQRLTNLTGLECARNLFSLDLSDNTIADPSPLAWITPLAYLYLNNCGLQEASFVSELTNLVVLELNGNQLHSLPMVIHLTGLQTLRLNNNGCLVNVPRLGALTNLIDLDVHSDCLPDLGITAEMSRLQTLDAGGDWMDDPNRNFISDISALANKHQLYWLSLSWDQVTNVPVIAGLTNLQNLYLSSNHFDNVLFLTNLPSLTNELTLNVSQVTNLAPVAGHPALRSLDIGYIQTTNLSAVSGLTNLTTLWAGGNHAGGAGLLAKLTRLQYLGFEMNGVSTLAPVNALTNLVYLNLEHNQLAIIDALSDKVHLNSLYLSGNRIHELSPLAGLTNLNWLSLNANGFTNIAPLSNLSGLVWLVLQSNHIQDLSAVAGLTNLSYTLDVSANEITDLSPVTNLHGLTWLGPWQNKLAWLPSMVGLTKLTSLDFAGNQLTNVAGLSGMTGLTWLGLNGNSFSVAPALTELPNLNTLELGTNHLTDVSGLAGLTSLNWLYLPANNLKAIHPLTALTHLNYVDLRYNLLDLSAGSAALKDIGQLQSDFTYVDYQPQHLVLLSSPMWLPGGQFRFTVQSQPGDTVRVWVSPDLMNWGALGWLTNTTGRNTFTDTSASGPNRFYRGQLY